MKFNKDRKISKSNTVQKSRGFCRLSNIYAICVSCKKFLLINITYLCVKQVKLKESIFK